ncbi:MAG: DUF3137 domain-containing protein [Acholeplasmataceae bacterium]
MEEKLRSIEARRVKLYEVYKKENKFGLIAFGLMLLVLAIFIVTQVVILLGFVFVFLITAIVFVGRAAVHASKFKDIIKTELITAMLEDQFEDVGYSHHQSIPIQTINATKMIKSPDRFSGEDYIKGRYKDVSFEVSDVDLKERVETRDSKGNRHVSYQTYFKGRWYIFKFGRKFDGTIKISEGSRWQMNTKGLIKMDTESIEFNKKFSIFASSQEYGFYQITPRILEKFMELEKLHRGSILYYFNEDELHIGVNDRRDYLELPLKKAVNQQALIDFKADIELIPAIINELKLDSDKFKNKEQKGVN